MQRKYLHGVWKFNINGEKDKCTVQVPGSVLSGYLENKKIEDPYFGTNEYKTRDIFWNEFEFQKSFDIEDEFLREAEICLVCNGIDTLGDIYINGEFVKATNNMHRTWVIPIKEKLKIGKNQIQILFHSTLKYIEDYKAPENKKIEFVSGGCSYGNNYIRKTHSMFGWDWGPNLPDVGIFRDIFIEGLSDIKIDSVYVKQEHLENKVILEFQVEERKIDEAQDYKINIAIQEPTENGRSWKLEKKATTNSQSLKVEIQNPKKWWPSGYGEQPLYKVKIEINKDGRSFDSQEFKIGLRTIKISQEKDKWGSEFAFQVNGLKIFTRGANYIPEDAIYSHITHEKMEYLIKSSVRANFNCLRIWGGGYFPSDEFYDLCDQYGLILWQDLLFACNLYEVTKNFEENVIAETIDNVKRLRNHACLGLWCGNNEMETGWVDWPEFSNHSQDLKDDYTKLFEQIFPKILKEYDPQTFYWPSSPSSGGGFENPQNENVGDVHYWDVWHGRLPFSDFRNHYFRFCSEFGFQSFPSIKTIKTFTEKKDRNIFSKVMESHQKNGTANEKIIYYLGQTFLFPKDFESLLYLSQIMQGLAIKTGVDHWRNNRGRCMGSLYWQLNDNWPVASWSSIDYAGRWKALHYMAKKFYAPIASNVAIEDGYAEVYLQNEKQENCFVKGKISLKDRSLQVLDTCFFEEEIEAYSAKKIFEKDYVSFFPEGIENIKESMFIEVILEFLDGNILTEVALFVPYKYFYLKKPNIKIDTKEDENEYKLEISSNVFTPFVELDFLKSDVIFSDNYFTLSNTEKKIIKIDKLDVKGKKIKNLKKELIVRTLYDACMVYS